MLTVKCYVCGADTVLYYMDKPICGPCDAKREKATKGKMLEQLKRIGLAKPSSKG